MLYMLLQVSYRVDGFIDKNKDLLFRDLSQLMFSCERQLLKDFFPEGDHTLRIVVVTLLYDHR